MHLLKFYLRSYTRGWTNHGLPDARLCITVVDLGATTFSLPKVQDQWLSMDIRKHQDQGKSHRYLWARDPHSFLFLSTLTQLQHLWIPGQGLRWKNLSSSIHAATASPDSRCRRSIVLGHRPQHHPGLDSSILKHDQHTNGV